MDKSLNITEFARFSGEVRSTITDAIAQKRIKSVVFDEKGHAQFPDPDKALKELKENRPLPRGKTESESYWKAKLAEIKYYREVEEVAPVVDMENYVVDTLTRVKTRLLALPSRVKQQIPHLTTAELQILESVVREALEEIKTGDGIL